MSTTPVFIEENREILLSIFSQIRSGREIELYINKNLCEDKLIEECCLDAILTLKYNKAVVDFPIKKQSKTKKIDEHLSQDLYTIILCEDAVRKGLLIRNGIKYSPIQGAIIKRPELYGKYLVS